MNNSKDLVPVNPKETPNFKRNRSGSVSPTGQGTWEWDKTVGKYAFIVDGVAQQYSDDPFN